MAFIEAKAIKVYYNKGDRKPYDVNGKPLSYLGQESIGANIATQVRFYLGEDLSESVTPIIVTKRADGERHFDILTEGTDTEVEPNQKYYYVNLSNWYAEKVGKLTIALKVYSGTVTIEDGEITASTGRIVVSDIFHVDVAYAPDASDLVPPFDPDYYEELLEALANKVERQEVIQVVNTLPTLTTDDNGKWFLVRQTDGGRLYRVIDGVAVAVETEMGKLKLTPTGNGEITADTGEFAFDQPNGTVTLGLYNDVYLQLGQEINYYGKAQGAIANGDIVQFADVQGDHYLVKKAVQSEINAKPELIMGMATQDIANGDFGYITAFGKINNVDTKGHAKGSFVWFDSNGSTAGNWVITEPTAPKAKVLVGVIVKEETSPSANNGIILVRPTFEPRLSKLQDVLITALNIDDVLRFDGTRWVNDGRLTTAEDEIDQLQSDVLGLDNTKADKTYVDSQDNKKVNKVEAIIIADNDKVALTVLGEQNVVKNIVEVKDGYQDNVLIINSNGDTTFERNVIVEGNFTINGTTTTVNTEQINIEDNIILINKNQTGTPSSILKSGIEVERGDLTNYQFVFDESDDRFKVGQVGSLQTVATRQEDNAITNNSYAFFNSTTKRFETNQTLQNINNVVYVFNEENNSLPTLSINREVSTTANIQEWNYDNSLVAWVDKDGNFKSVNFQYQEKFKQATITISSSDWVSNQATKTVSGLKSTDIVWINPAPSSYYNFTNSGIRAISQGTNTLTFERQYAINENITILVIYGE